MTSAQFLHLGGELYFDVVSEEAVSLSAIFPHPRVKERVCRLAPIEGKLLTLLLLAQGQRVSYQEIVRTLYREDLELGTHAPRLRSILSKLRRKVATAGVVIEIETVRTIGYRILPPGGDRAP